MFELINTTKGLQNFVDKISDAKWLAIDTEFLREDTYFAKLCLIQIEANGHRACIDPLAIKDYSAFTWLMHNPDIIKVFHTARQDLEILLNMTGQVPSPIFDTQVAASVLGIGEQMSYARLVENILGVYLAKTQSRTNWEKRPLRDAQLKYAIDDVRYLAQIYPIMVARLKAQNRLNWLDSDFEKATNSETYTVNFNECWKKVKGKQALSRPQLAVLRELAAWREDRAQKSNRPRKWILRDDILLDMAKQQPKTAAAIKEIRGLNLTRWQKNHKTWLALIKKGKAIPKAERPELSRTKKPTPNEKALIELLLLVIQVQAKEHNITATAIATRKRIEDMVLAGETSLSDDWRGTLANDAIASVVSGARCIGLQNGRVVLVDVSS